MRIVFLILFILIPLGAFAGENNSLKNDLTHMLNRLSFGPRPGEIEALLKLGKKSKEQWIELQLNPDKIDDSALDEKLKHIKSLDMETRDLYNYYKKPEDLAMELGLKIDLNDSKKDIRKEVKEAIGIDRFPDALIAELQSQKLIRANESQKQLQEVLVDFWFNHFNIDAGKNEIKYVAYNYENEVIRKNIFRTFPEMLLASARHPAMLNYLDNRLSRKNALNENYAREIMELHTLGVDGGYSQKDVQELARILTGWSIKDLKEDPQFLFKEKAHDTNDKNWLGLIIPAKGGEEEGQKAILHLALHPKTAHHIAEKLVKAFVDDNPPVTLIKKCEEKFLSTKGDLKEVYRTIFYSPEFWRESAHQTKIKKPFQLMISSLRALGGEILSSNDLIKSSKTMGEELFRAGPPTGFKDDASSWVNPGSMISRLQFALDLSSQKFSGVLIQWPSINKNQTSDQQIKAMAKNFGLLEISPATFKIIKRELELEPALFANRELKPSYMGKMAGMILGSPEFQRK